MGLIYVSRLEKTARKKARALGLRVSEKALQAIARALEEQAERMLEFSFLQARSESLNTLLERHAERGIQEARYSYISGLVSQLGLRVQGIQQEIEEKNAERKKLFGSVSSER